TYAWSFAKAPPGSVATLNSPSSPSPGFVPDVAGEYDIELQLTDSSGHTNTQVFSTSAGKALVGVSTCGTLAPTASISLDAPVPVAAPAPSQVLFTTSTVVFDGASSSSPDQVPLAVAAGSGCGLDPSFTYRWRLDAAPFFATDTIVSPDNVTSALATPTDAHY